MFNRSYRRLMAFMAFALAAVLLATLPGANFAQAQNAATVSVGGNDTLGKFLVGPNGMTLYMFTKDTLGVSNCYDQCATNWPPLTVDAGAMPTAGEGVPGKLGTAERKDGALQVTYNDMPLYYWAKDTQVGDATGQNVGEVWFVVAPESVVIGGNDTLGAFLTAANGMTLYMFTKDAPGVSNCYDQCATNWPPLTLAKNETPVAGRGVLGKLATTERKDGTLQVTYNDMPLYFWAKDAKVGDSTGQNVGEVWFVIKPETVQIGENADLGKFLVGPNRMTLYMFTKDTPGVSNCYDQCATNWPPLLVVKGEMPTAEKGLSGKLGVAERKDGTFQVTYDDMPLYYWAKDKVPGDATGQKVNDVWFVVAAK